MAKRFIDTNLFRKTFIRGLSSPHKLLWIYLFCDCSHAGIWEIDYELASLFVGSKIKKSDIDVFGDKILFISDNKIFIPEFIEFQYGELKQNNNAHISVIRELKKYSLLDENMQYNFEGLMRGLSAPMEMDKDKEKKMDKVKEINIEFDYFWNLYDKKVGEKSKIKLKWDRLMNEERSLIIEYIPKYISSQPDKQYRKNPETFLNNKSWNDEIIEKQSTSYIPSVF